MTDKYKKVHEAVVDSISSLTNFKTTSGQIHDTKILEDAISGSPLPEPQTTDYSYLHVDGFQGGTLSGKYPLGTRFRITVEEL